MENRISFSTLNRGLYNYNKENVENRNDFVFAKKKKKERKRKKKGFCDDIQAPCNSILHAFTFC
jgi:hypothetical protein